MQGTDEPTPEAAVEEGPQPVAAAPLLPPGTLAAPAPAPRASASAPALGPYRASPPPPMDLPFSTRVLRGRELLAVLALVVLADVVLFDGNRVAPGGFGLALLFGLAPLAMLGSAPIFRRSRALLLVSALLAVVALRSAVDPTALTTLTGLVLLMVFGVALRLRSVSSREVLGSSLQTVGVLPWRVSALSRGLRAQLDRTRLRQGSCVSVAIPLLLCLLFLPVLAFANATFASLLSSAWGLLLQLGVPGPLRVITWCFVGLAALGLVRPSLMPNGYSDAAPAGVVFDAQQRAVARNSLVALNALFLVFIALDVTVLATGHAPDGHTTQRYAHEGAFWLTVALAMLTLVLSVMFAGALAHDPSAERTRQLAYGWIAQGVVMALCTYGRIVVHVQFSGLSNLRIVGFLGTSLVVVGMLLVGVKLRRTRSFTWLLRRQTDAFFVTTVLFAVLPTHYLGARFNVARVAEGAYAPLIHMEPQAAETESVLALLPLAEHADPAVRHAAADLLLAQLAGLRRDEQRATYFAQHSLLLPLVRAELARAEPRLRAELTQPELAGEAIEGEGAVVDVAQPASHPTLRSLGYDALHQQEPGARELWERRSPYD